MDDLANSGCKHRWVLGEPGLNGIAGRCRNCGANRLYPSSLDVYEPAPDYDELDRNRIVRSIEVTTLGERTPAA